MNMSVYKVGQAVKKLREKGYVRAIRSCRKTEDGWRQGCYYIYPVRHMSCWFDMWDWSLTRRKAFPKSSVEMAGAIRKRLLDKHEDEISEIDNLIQELKNMPLAA